MTTISLIVITMLVFAPSPAEPRLAQRDQIAKADELFAERDNPDAIKQAVVLMEQLVAREPSNFDAWWRLARVRYYAGDREKDQTKKTRLFQAGIEAAKKAITADPKRFEGHFWFGANQGEYADLRGALKSLGLVKNIRKEFEAALAIDPSYENGAIYSALGQIDLNLPRLFGGNERRGIERLEAGLKAGPDNAELKITLGEVYQKKGRRDEARKLFESVLSANDQARTPVEMDELRAKARGLLDKFK
jgi:tetratricopeptide (TPR) repeat protein